jgi:hypothetical protein
VSPAEAQQAQEAAAAAAAAPATPGARQPIVAPGGQPAVVTPNGSTLPLRLVNGVKVGHLVAEPVRNTFAPGLTTECWGYNGSTPGPTIEAVEGDRLRIYVTNRLPEPTTVHWHGLVLPNGMDGVAGLSQRPIPPGETYVYDFTLRYPGTYMYHPHYDEMTQIALGMTGMFIVHPLRPRGARVDRDFVLMMHEWKIDPGARRPNPNAMSDFNVLTFNGKSYPLTAPLVVGKGERVRIRLGNLGPMDHHPIHLHGLSFEMTATDGGYVAPSARHPETTVLVPVGSTRVIEFVPEESGRLGDALPHDAPRDDADGPRAAHGRREHAGPRPSHESRRAGLHDDGYTGHGRHGRDADGRPREQRADAWWTRALRIDRHGRHVHPAQGARAARCNGPGQLVPTPARHGGGAGRRGAHAGGRGARAEATTWGRACGGRVVLRSAGCRPARSGRPQDPRLG